nr:transglycosylase domain-containing protein [Anaerolineae bacterium]
MKAAARIRALNPQKRALLWAIIGISVVGGLAAGIWLWLLRGLPDPSSLDAGLHIPSIRITDRYGTLLYEVIDPDSARHNPVALEEIPAACINATLATEDAHFYENPGFDMRAIARSLWINIQGGEVLTGGSTITQQVVRNLLLTPEERSERTLRRKLREAVLAYRLTQHYGKEHILALYLNQTDYGNLSYGIDAASRAYFGKPASRLDLAECALLAGLPQAPSLYDPLTNLDAAKERQRVVLELMADEGYITAGQVESAYNEPLSFAAERYSIEAPHFVMAVIAGLESILPPEVLAQGGLVVRTTLDLDWQMAAEQIARRHLESLNEPLPGEIPHNAQNAALVAMDPHTGQVLVMMGSPDYFDPDISGAVNMALALRQPGSTLKPFTYALALDPDQDAPWTAATMLLDVYTSFVTNEGFAYAPVNYDHQEHGPVSLREALASSYNIPAVLALDRVGVGRLLRLLAELGITTFSDPSQYDLSITLGGGDVRLLELAGAYAALANGGVMVHPILVLDVRNSEGEVLFEQASALGGRVLDERVAWLISDILSDNNARAPAFTTHSILQIGRPAAVKTGTTTDYRDNWTIGYTPDLVAGVWVGNADSSSMVGISGVSGAGPIWHQFMRTVLLGRPQLDFARPEGLAQAEVCSLSGLLPTNDCPYTRTEWFIEGTAPSGYDTMYVAITVDSLTGLPPGSSIPEERLETRLFLDLPPQAYPWARRNGIPLLADLQLDEPVGGVDELHILSPDPGTIYQIDLGIPRGAQRIRIVVIGPPDLETVEISLNGTRLQTFAAPPYEVWWELVEGDYLLGAVGQTDSGDDLAADPVHYTVRGP